MLFIDHGEVIEIWNNNILFGLKNKKNNRKVKSKFFVHRIEFTEKKKKTDCVDLEKFLTVNSKNQFKILSRIPETNRSFCGCKPSLFYFILINC